MTKKIAAITISLFVLYSYFLCAVGLFGETVQNFSIFYGLIALKYGLVLIGFIAVIFLPYRIHKALLQRAEEKYQRESNKKIMDAAEREKQKQAQILQEYIKQEDSI